jgi:hypothetical protein
METDRCESVAHDLINSDAREAAPTPRGSVATILALSIPASCCRANETASRNMGEGWKKKVHELVTIATEGEERDADS